jgi:acetate kinase
MNKEEMTMHEMNTLLNKHSGIQGLSGLSSDMREIEEVFDGNDQALLAHQVFCYRLKKYIGAYCAAMNGVDAIVFTGGIGENSSVVRRDTLNEMQYLGVDLDSKKNKTKKSSEREIQSQKSKVKILIQWQL